MCRQKLQAKQMRTRLVWHRYWLTESRNCSRLSDRKTWRECQAEGTVKEKLVGQLVDWLMEGWDKTGRPYHVWSSVTSSPSPYILRKKKKDHGEKNRPPFIRMREVGTRTRWQICRWQWWWPSVISSSHTSLPCRVARSRAHTCIHTHRPCGWGDELQKYVF